MPTRFYFPASGSTTRIRPTLDTIWSGTSLVSYHQMRTIKGRSPIVTGAIINATNGNANCKDLDRVYVSPALWGNQVVSGICSGQLMTREYVSNDNMDQIHMKAYITSNNGGTVRGTMLSLANRGPTTEFTTAVTHQNKSIITGKANFNTVTGFDGDRIVLEIGYASSAGGTTPQSSARWGENGPDLPSNNELQTTDGAGWVEFSSVNLRFKKNLNFNVIS
jgi:hypothetical protein